MIAELRNSKEVNACREALDEIQIALNHAGHVTPRTVLGGRWPGKVGE